MKPTLILKLEEGNDKFESQINLFEIPVCTNSQEQGLASIEH